MTNNSSKPLHNRKKHLVIIKMKFFQSLLFFIFISCSLFAQKADEKPPLTRILFIFDASNSMNGNWQSDKKIKIARKLLVESLDSLQFEQNLQFALRIYGHQTNYMHHQDCEDTELAVPFGAYSIPKIKSELYGIRPKGTTLIAYSLEKAAGDFPPCADCRNIIILITDGLEECNGDPCAVSLALQEKGIILKPFVIGVGLDVHFKKTFECVGNYFDAANEETFKKALGVVISQALNSTTAQVNLLDIDGNPNETNVNMTFYDNHTGKIHYNFVHTINNKGNPDTLTLDPVPIYDIVVHTIPPVKKDSFDIAPGIHNIFGIDAAQGNMHLVTPLNSNYKNLDAIIRKDGEMQTLNVQKFGSTVKYLVGKYDVEVLSLPRILIEDVKISQSHTTKVEIPRPGIATVLMNSIGYGSLYVQKGNKLEWIYNLTESSTKESLTLQPGNYRVVFRAKGAKASIFTTEKSFKVRSGSSIAVKLF